VAFSSITPTDDHDRVTQVLDHVELVTGEQHTASSARSFDEHLTDRVDSPRVEAGERLVEDQQLGVVNERGGELHPLLVAV
jgi:hypothetical protein